MNYLQTVVTTLQAVMPTSQQGAFHCVTKTVSEWPDPPPRAGDAIHPVLLRECGLVHETSSGCGVFVNYFVWKIMTLFSASDSIVGGRFCCICDVLTLKVYPIYHKKQWCRSQVTPENCKLQIIAYRE